MPVVFTGRADGDQRDPACRRGAVPDAPAPWTVLRQVHADRVVVVTSPGEHAGADADAAVTAAPGCALAILTADCAPVALVSTEAVGVAHAGWRGLQGGVLERTVDAMRSLGATAIEATVGPCIRASCYEFGADDLDAVAASLGEVVRGTTRDGRPALDLAAGVHASLARAGVDVVHDDGACTACEPGRWYSHRARRDPERQAVVAWI